MAQMKGDQKPATPQAQPDSGASPQPVVSSDPSKQVNQKTEPMLKKIPQSNAKSNVGMVIVSLLVVLAGAGTGWLLTGTSKGSTKSSTETVETVVKNENEAGVEDESAFPDSAEGILEDGGIDGEGTHHLVREGGPTKYVYLTSTVIDLESFNGKTVQVWGETTSARSAGWLMDVGKLKVIE